MHEKFKLYIAFTLMYKTLLLLYKVQKLTMDNGSLQWQYYNGQTW